MTAHPVEDLRRLGRWWTETRTPVPVAFRRPWPTTRRGLVLAFFSIAVGFLGVSNYLLSDLPPVSRESLSFALAIAPPHLWGWVMVALGALSLWSAYCHLGRDRIGFVLLSTFTGVWGIGYLCGFLFYDAGPRALGGSVIWLLFAGILTTVAGFPNMSLHKADELTQACHPDSRWRP